MKAFDYVLPTLALVATLLSSPVLAETDEGDTIITPRLVADMTKTKAGFTGLVGVHFAVPEGWHFYWKNSGELGIPTKISIVTPPAVRLGTLQWPAPSLFAEEDQPPTYGYKKDTVVYAPFEAVLPEKHSEILVRAKVSWLACDPSQCVPEKAMLSGILGEANPETKSLLAQAKELVPVADLASLPISRTSVISGEKGAIKVRFAKTPTVQKVEWFPESATCVKVEGAQIESRKEEATLTFTALREPECSETPAQELNSVVKLTDGNGSVKSGSLLLKLPHAK